MKKTVTFLIFLITCFTCFGQQVPVVSQYMYNRLAYNPAYAGVNEQLGASLIHRSQWMGIKGAPATQLLTIDGPLGENAGLGATIGNNHTGVTNQTDLLANYSYHIGASGLHAGISAGFSYYQANLTKAFVWQPEDPVFSEDIRSAILPKAGMGVYYFDGFLYAGLSVPDLLVYDGSKIFTSPDGSVRSLKRNYIFTGGYSILINDQLQLEPSLFIKYHPSYPLLVNLNCNVRFSDKFTAGASYRINNAFTGLIQLKLYDKIKMGYAFDIYQPNVRFNYFGTHELMLSYNLDFD